jgi:AraC-like DNA-binding protein
VFERVTGATIHRYLTRLRLRVALARIADGESNLTALALDLGFSSHSHLTSTFAREFGAPPSRLRAELSQPRPCGHASASVSPKRARI